MLQIYIYCMQGKPAITNKTTPKATTTMSKSLAASTKKPDTTVNRPVTTNYQKYLQSLKPCNTPRYDAIVAGIFI